MLMMKRRNTTAPHTDTPMISPLDEDVCDESFVSGGIELVGGRNDVGVSVGEGGVGILSTETVTEYFGGELTRTC